MATTEIETRKLFWKSGFQVCPVCRGSLVKETNTVEGCRYNGDAYGFITFTCNSSGCNWSSIFRYDDASEVYYYETTYWVIGQG